MSNPTTPLELAAQQHLPAAAALQLWPQHGDNRRSEEEKAGVMSRLVFGAEFSDFMSSARWNKERGWHDMELLPYGPIPLDPSANVLHYSQTVFEGVKVYRHPDGSVWTFRPSFNAARLAASCHRMALPQLAAEDYLASIVSLVRADIDYVPSEPGSSLYLRPFIFGDNKGLGIRPSETARYLCIASPSGPYFKGEQKGVEIWVSETYHRAGPGGVGAAKTGGNYAASLLPQLEARDLGYAQVCYLDAVENRYLEELGGMNVFVVYADGSVVTPSLTGTILEGCTRSSILHLLAENGRQVKEDRIDFGQLLVDIESGKVTEMFACGTAAVVTSIAKLGHKGGEAVLQGGEVTAHVHDTLTGIQFGTIADPYGWMYRLA